MVKHLLWLAALAVAAAAPVAGHAQQMIQSGKVVPGHAARVITDKVFGDAGPAGGGPAGVGLTELNITSKLNGGFPFCINDAPITGPYRQMCAGPDGFTVNSFSGASQTPLQFTIYGEKYDFPISLSGILGPNTSQMSYAPLWNNSTGSLLKNGAPTGAMWTDQGATITRLGDRVFIGLNTNANTGGVPGPAGPNRTDLGVTDWLEKLRINTTSNAQLAVLSQIGSIGVLGGARTSDSPNHGDSLAVAGFCSGNTANVGDFGFPGCWAGYFEARHELGATNTYNQGIETDAVEFNTLTIQPSPYNLNTAAVSVGNWIASGGGYEGAKTAGLGIGIVNNGVVGAGGFFVGLGFDRFAIAGTDGSDGAVCCGNAIQLARMQGISFFNSGTTTSHLPNSIIYSAVTSAMPASTQNLRFDDKGTMIEDADTGQSIAIFTSQFGMELGPAIFAATGVDPYIDFHFGNNSVQDYNVRIINDADETLHIIGASSGNIAQFQTGQVFLFTPFFQSRTTAGGDFPVGPPAVYDAALFQLGYTNGGTLVLGPPISAQAKPAIQLHFGSGLSEPFNVMLQNDAANTLSLSANSGAARLRVIGMPTSCSGLLTGTLINNSGVVNVCP